MVQLFLINCVFGSLEAEFPNDVLSTQGVRMISANVPSFQYGQRFIWVSQGTTSSAGPKFFSMTDLLGKRLRVSGTPEPPKAFRVLLIYTPLYPTTAIHLIEGPLQQSCTRDPLHCPYSAHTFTTNPQQPKATPKVQAG